jgi:hypothetical protein
LRLPAMQTARLWAQATFGCVDLGDVRRTDRLVRMATSAAEGPAGQVTQVFHSSAERQGAYDLLNNEAVLAASLTGALSRSVAVAAQEHEHVLVVLDGTSLTLTDRYKSKGLGRIGPFGANASGLKLINALALAPDGTPIGVADQNWWVRTSRVPSGYRGINERESVRWRECVTRVSDHFAALDSSTRIHFLADRDGDAALLIETIQRAGHEFTIRSNATRKVLGRKGAAKIRPVLSQLAPLATMKVQLSATPRRAARLAKLTIRALKLEVRLRDHHTHGVRVVPLTFVWAREQRRNGPIDWMLMTNTPATTARDACEVVRRYAKRWRIEDFHRTWKSGACNVEQTQLRSANAIIKWATILAAVAGRAETLRHAARTNPDAPATTILSDDEIQALVLLKTRVKSRVETVTADGLTVVQAVRWIADLGGYVGNKSSGKPGPTTIGRGFEDVRVAAAVIAQLRSSGELR